MACQSSLYHWSTEMPSLLADDTQNLESQDPLQPFWPWAYEPRGYEPPSGESIGSSPDSAYQQGPLELPFSLLDDYFDLDRIDTPTNNYDNCTDSTQVVADTASTGANKRIRRQEQNRASQRAYRDRQRGKIAELQSKVVTLKAQNEKLKARNEMLEAAFQRDRRQITSAPALHRHHNSHGASLPNSRQPT